MKFRSFIFLMFVSPQIVWADSHLTPLTLENVLQRVWQNSPITEAQKLQTEIALGDRWRRYLFNEPQLTYANSDDNSAHSYGISLVAPFPGKSFALSKLDSARAEVQKAEVYAKKYDLAKIFTQAFLDCASSQAAFEIQKLTSNDLDTVAQTLKSRYETGHSTQAEKIGSELQSRQAQFDLITAQDKQTATCKKLKALIQTTSTGLISYENFETLLPDDIDPRLIAELGDLTADESRARTSIDVAEASFSTALWMQLPDFSLSVNRNQYLYLPGSPSGKEWTTTYTVSVTLPLLFPFHESVESRRLKSQARIDKGMAELQKATANSDVRDAAQEYLRSQKRLVELRQKDLALAEALVESTYSAYRTGKLGYAELVLSRKTLSDIRNQDIQLRVSIIASHLRCLNHCQTENQTPEKTL